ncbi:MAG: hypothetical protein V1904_13720 [Bacteroidota bacterium]
MEQHNSDKLTGSYKKRPVFLTVLCIISLVGILFVFYSSSVKLFSLSYTENFFQKISSLGIQMAEPIDYGNFVYNTKIYHIINLIASLVCLAGVTAMWKLKKAGYFIYAVGELAPTVTFFILFGIFFHNPLMPFTFLLTAILMFVVAVAFLIMYTVNLKHMSWKKNITHF